jgi:hypothetical protein
MLHSVTQYTGVLYTLSVIRFLGDFTDTRYKSTALLEPICTKLRNTQQNYVCICYTEFYRNRKINVESTH